MAFPSVKTGRVEAAQSPSVAASGPQDSSPQYTGAARIIDGDTLALGEVKIRLHGIDAPEIAQTCSDMHGAIWTCGQWSKAALERLATGTITCVQKDIDRYGRIVGTCFAQGVDMNAAMVAKGAAFAYVQYSRDYVSHEAQARRVAAGMWRSGVQAPSDYRSDKRAATQARQAAAEVPSPEGCAIKGNISKSGRLYHLPGSRWYDGTRINEGQGERWFCSENDAKAAGWRAARG
ncbi:MULTISPECIES: thermonuclease family protein [Pacificibacter]|uniref:thermonuclease family protein n=1 Tax=Pacificibacter TaxID=1042323 RepID=UPI0026E1D555|nr:thermonuclease family protein [Pacificibacter sp. 1_MG-2023]MDO6615653.1 thermonuclease family protein [Pacificibacter sp. 1_MG-2023]